MSVRGVRSSAGSSDGDGEEQKGERGDEAAGEAKPVREGIEMLGARGVGEGADRADAAEPFREAEEGTRRALTTS